MANVDEEMDVEKTESGPNIIGNVEDKQVDNESLSTFMLPSFQPDNRFR